MRSVCWDRLLCVVSVRQHRRNGKKIGRGAQWMCRTVETGLDRRQELVKLEVAKGVQHILCRHGRAPCLLGKIVGAASRDAEDRE